MWWLQQPSVAGGRAAFGDGVHLSDAVSAAGQPAGQWRGCQWRGEWRRGIQPIAQLIVSQQDAAAAAA
jgi:hypothetical protein